MKALVIPAAGIGDALLMMISAHQLKENGYDVTVFHEGFSSFKEWFLEVQIERFDLSKVLNYDLVIMQNDDTEKSNQLRHLRRKNKRGTFHIFYPRYKFVKHGYLEPCDFVFDPSLTMVENIAKSTQELLQLDDLNTKTGISIPPSLQHKKYLNRVLLQPTCSKKERCWTAKKFVKLAKKLKEIGYDPQFTVAPHEIADWAQIEKMGYSFPRFEKLTDLAAYIYESGHVIGNDSLLGHIASLLEIPTTILAKDPRHMALWRPGWLKGRVVTPPSWVINCKGLRLREKYWKQFIFMFQILKDFPSI